MHRTGLLLALQADWLSGLHSFESLQRKGPQSEGRDTALEASRAHRTTKGKQCLGAGWLMCAVNALYWEEVRPGCNTVHSGSLSTS